MFGKKKDPEVENVLSENDVKEMLANCKCYNVKDMPRNPWRIESLPEARMRDKLSRDRNLSVTTSSFDPETKSIKVEFVTKVDQTDVTSFTYKQICEHFGWLSFDVSDNQQTIYPKW